MRKKGLYFLSRACQSVGRSVGRWTLAFIVFSLFLSVFCIIAPAQMLELACFLSAPAHPHATSVAVYPAMFYRLINGQLPVVCNRGLTYPDKYVSLIILSF